MRVSAAQDGEPWPDYASMCSLSEPVRAALWELSVGMRPLCTAPHALPSWLEVGSVYQRWRRDGRDRGGKGEGRGVDQATCPQAMKFAEGGEGGAGGQGRRSQKGKTGGGGCRLDVDTKCDVISHVV